MKWDCGLLCHRPQVRRVAVSGRRPVGLAVTLGPFLRDAAVELRVAAVDVERELPAFDDTVLDLLPVGKLV
jgi:hypothetical protein